MRRLLALVRRNVTLFFRDKGMFFTALITPMILLVLYATFLGNVYRDSFLSGMPQGLTVSEKIIDGLVGGQLVSSLLAVRCVTVAFCSNMLMVQDKVSRARQDLTVSPLPEYVLALSYYLATFLSTLLICLVATLLGLAYLGSCGWYLSTLDLVCLLIDVLLTVLFGTALSSVIHHFLSTQGQISAVGTIVSSVYGFLCGAYMPISQFSPALQKVLSFLPGTYATVLMRRHTMQGALAAMVEEGVPRQVAEELGSVVDCTLHFFDTEIPEGVLYAVPALTTLVLMLVYLGIQYFHIRKGNK